IGVAILFVIGLSVLLRRGYVTVSANFLSAGLWVLFTYAIFIRGGVQSPIFSSYILVIVISGTLSGKKTTLTFGLLSLFVGFVTLFLNLDGALPAPSTPILALWITQSLTLAMVTVILSLVAQNVWEVLERARQSERTLAKRNSELEYEIAERKRI